MLAGGAVTGKLTGATNWQLTLLLELESLINV